MAKRTIEIPEELSHLADALEAMVKRSEEFSKQAKSGGPVDFSALERDVAEAGKKAQLDVLRRALQECDVDARHVLINGKRHVAVGRHEAEYFTKEGAVRVTRNLYRECGVRNGPTLDVVSCRTGALDRWLPEAAKAIAFLMQQGTSREAEATAKALGTLPYSRASMERVGHAVGELVSVVRVEMEETLRSDFRVPEGATSVSLSLDRVAVPMEEPRAKPPGRPVKGAPKKPISRVWHMAFVGTATFHDAKGEALRTLRYGRMPGLGCDDLLASLLADTCAALKQQPSLHVVLLADGAKEMEDALDRTFNHDTLGAAVHIVRLVDFFHVVEKLGAAAVAIHGDASKTVVHRWSLLLLNSENAANRIANELYASGCAEVRVGVETPVKAALTYLRNQRPRMNYAAAKAAGLPIGSGNVEATCKSLVGHRLVRSGSRWKESTGQHVLDLRALALSDRFNAGLHVAFAPLVRPVLRAA